FSLMSGESRALFTEELISRAELFVTEKFKEADIPGGVFGIAEEDKTVLKKGIGFSAAEGGRNFDEGTVFNAGTLSRQFTALKARKLIEEGKLKPDARVTEYIPEWKLGGKGKENYVLVRHLIDSCSLLEPFHDRIVHSPDGSLFFSFRDMLPSFADLNVLDSPDDVYKESSLNYILLGEILKRISGRKKFSEIIQTDIFAPLFMNESTFEQRSISRNRSAHYSYFFGKRSELQFAETPLIAESSEKVFTNLNDLLKYLLFCIKDESDVLKYTSVAQLRKAAALNGRNGEPFYGSGWFHSELLGQKYMFFSGKGAGSSIFLFYYPERKSAFVIAGNLEAESSMREIGEGVISILFGVAPKNPRPPYRKLLGMFCFVLILGAVMSVYALGFKIDRLYSPDFISTGPSKENTVGFAVSMAVFVLLFWTSFRVLPYHTLLTEYTSEIRQSAMFGWVPELFYASVALVILSFLWMVYSGLVLIRNSR
ncbi:MAG TPA: serine hydrolase domain-containing protein, partial [Leptospiraceae bacterium]|nr:serine hydrolase domain-containing protein [Leptospiraceae bacterium]